MTPLFLPMLVNDPFGDPAVFMQVRHEKMAVLFDLGDLSQLPIKKLLKVTHIFVSHCHIDHFIGFDHLLRCVLGRQKKLHLFGPPGIIGHVHGKLAGYTWNLVSDYPLSLTVTEIHLDQRLQTTTFFCRNGFALQPLHETRLLDDTILTLPQFSLKAVILDHKIPCAAYRLQEPFHINFRSDVLDREQWPRGSWLTEVRKAIRDGLPEGTCFTVCGRSFMLGELTRRLAIITPGQAVGYITDIAASQANLERAAALIDGCDRLFCEAAFLADDEKKADLTCHLTAAQAGRLACLAKVKKLILFHFSPKNHARQGDYYREAGTEFAGPIA
ncbi:MAG: ribonuclease Z [Deltaproteobacteria bacterium]|nr:ribonuclease Z [Candidatus Anaeroferrophillus wilburensis]MBN2888845.1 ribonuclease Z [Deltaproteobacteria bacterium]